MDSAASPYAPGDFKGEYVAICHTFEERQVVGPLF